jgi:PAS domain S-box-containing protein
MRQWFTPPVFEDEEKTQQAFMLHIILWALILVPVPYVLYVLIQTPADIGRALAQAIFGETINLFLLFLLKRGQVRLAAIMQVIAFWAFFTLTAVTGSGVRGVAYLLGYGLVIVIAGVLLGSRGALVATIGVILSGGLMVLAETKGQFSPVYLDEPFTVWIISMVLFPVSAVLQHLAARAMRQALARARTSEARNRAIVETLPDTLFSFNDSGVFTDFYAPNRQPLLIPPDQFIGKSITEVLPPFLAELTQQHICQALATRQIQIYEYALPLGENILHYEARMMAVREKEVLAIVRDITTRKRAEDERERLIADLEAKNAELERFTYTVSHDLKSPLVTIRGFLGYLENDAVSGNLARLHTDLGRISRAADKMQQLLNDLLELSRIGRLMNLPEEISLETIVHEAVELVRGRLKAHHIQVQIAPNLPVVYGDRLRLVETVQNLIDNACKFMGNQPQPRVEIGVDEAQDQPVFFVRDNGIGIDPAYHNQIFGLFNKLDPQSEGTGVGLALVKRIIEMHGGKIWVESDGIGQGATFYFTLPKTLTPAPLSAGDVAPATG